MPTSVFDIDDVTLEVDRPQYLVFVTCIQIDDIGTDI